MDAAEGREALACLADVFRRHGATAWIDFGTLLGAVRTGEFIPWDKDIDWSCRSEEVSEDLVADLFKVVRHDGHRSFWPDGLPGGIHAFFGLTRLAIQPWRLQGDQLLYLSFLGKKKVTVPNDLVFPLSTVTIEGTPMGAPGRQEEYLAFIYGPSWKTPDPQYIHSPEHRRNQARWFSSA